MDFNLVSNLEYCKSIVDSELHLLLYSHIPTAIISLLIGIFVYIKNRKNISAKTLLFIALLFSFWTFSDLIIWIYYYKNGLVMFMWSLLGIVAGLIFASTLYFFYSFIDKSDINFPKKIILSLLLLPIIFLTPTRYNLTSFNIQECYAVEGNFFTNYYYFVGAIIFFWILSVAVLRLRKESEVERRQLILLTLGVEMFLLLFFVIGFIASFLIDNGYITGSYGIEQYGLFGMPVFMAFLAYLIVQYKAFHIKLLGAQALVISMIVLVGSQYFYAQNTTAYALTTVTLVLSLVFGYILILSVKRDDERKEQLQAMADKLAQANDQLRKLDNAKTEFISIASHQLRTPITAIKGFASLLLEGSYGEISDSVHGALEKVYSSSERLVMLIEDLLNVSRIESGRMQFDFKKESVEKLIKELYDNFLLIAKNKKFYLDMKLPEVALPEVLMDYSKIRELVSNFIDNALKYTEKGGVTIKAELLESGVVVDENGFVIPNKKSEFGRMIRITVSDTGIGIPKEEIPYLFKKFSRGKDVSRLHVGGTGLGLYVGKAIAEAHHGQVWVESDGAGLGSRFIIEIPVAGDNYHVKEMIESL